MRRVLLAIVKLARDSGMTDEDIAKDLLLASQAVSQGYFWDLK